MVKIRRYRKSDLEVVASIVWDQWEKFVASDYCKPEGAKYWRNYLKPTKGNIENLAKRYAGETISLVATNNGKIVGTAMGTKDELVRLYVHHRYHGKGIGRSLMQRFEQQCIQRGSTSIRIRSSLYAVPFYLTMGCKKTTGKRNFRGLKCQSMKKIL